MNNVIEMKHPLIQHKISRLRDKNTGTAEFRALVEEIAMLMGYEALKDLPLEDVEVETPIEKCMTPQIAGKNFAIVPILRAGLGMVSGLQALVPTAKIGHIGLYRDEETHEPHEYYCKLPSPISERLIVVTDPMLATGGSAVAAVDFIKQHKDEPFFMYFATNDVHVPRFPHDRFRGKNPMGLRGDAIAQFDWTVGQLMETLDQLGLTENTLIILSSDNGPVVDDGYKDKAEELLNGHTPSGPWRGNKYSAFEGGTAVPVIVRWPQKIKKTGDSDVLMSQIDWLASLGALVNARLPKGSAPDSYDRLGNLIGTDKTDRPWIVEQSMNHTLSVRTKDWKYIEPNDDPTTFMKAEKIETGNLNIPQLYEMEKVSEQENVAEKYPKKVFELQTILRQVRNKRIKM